MTLLVPQYLRADEEASIHRQFQGDRWRRNRQVLWSGIPRDEAQRWADEHEMQTLTTAMGPLMDLSHPLCLRKQKSSDAWSKYVKGASALFAWYIARGERVTVLSPPPPERFHPSGQTNYQAIEEPIVKGMLGAGAVSQIEMVHPTVEGAENICYQIWPVDNTTTWTARFGELNVQKRRWRMVKPLKALSTKLGNMEIAKAHQDPNAKEKTTEVKEKEVEKEERKGKKAKARKKRKVNANVRKQEKEKTKEAKEAKEKEEKAKKAKKVKEVKEEKAKAKKKKKKAKVKVKRQEKEKAKEAKEAKEKEEKEKAKKLEEAKEKAKKKAEEEKKVARKAKKEKKAAKKEKKKAKKKAKKMEKEEKANNKGRSELIS